MFTKQKPKSKLDLEVDRLVLALKDHKPDSKEYAAVVAQLKELAKIQKDNKSESVSPDTKVTAAVHIAGILLIIKHESVNVIASKAISFVPKLR